MLKLNIIVIHLMIFTVFAGSLANSTEKSHINWFFHLGQRGIFKDNITIASNDNVTNGNGSSFTKVVFLPIAVQQDCRTTKRVSTSATSLVDLGGSLYYFETYFQTNFFKAMQSCRDRGMNLLSIESSEENEKIINHIAENHDDLTNFWTSGSDLGQEGHFVWLATGKAFKYTYWSRPQPDNAGKNEHCVEIRRHWKNSYGWNDIGCNHNSNFICELPKCTDFCLN